MVVLVTGWTACGGSGDSSSKVVTLAVIPKGTTHEFWKSIHAGALKAAEEASTGGREVKVIWRGPLKEDDVDQQKSLVETFITRRVDGIVLAPLDSRALAGSVQLAARARVPVVIIDSGLESDLPKSFIATDNYAGGAMAAREVGRLLNGKGKVLMLRYMVGSASTEQREEGFLETIQAEFPLIELVSTDQYAGADSASAQAKAENLLIRFKGELDAVFTPNESSTLGMSLALRGQGLAGGRLVHVGFDSGSFLIDALRSGDIQALVVQDPFTMGYLGVQTMLKVLAGEKVEPRIDTPVRLVTRDNLETEEIRMLLHPPLERFLGPE